MDAISTLVSSADATTNLFEVNIGFPNSREPDSLSNLNISFRINEFNPPNPSIKMLDIPYRGHTIRIPSASVQHSRTLQLKVRIDKNYALYKQLLTIRDTLFSPTTEAITPYQATRATVEVKALAGDLTKEVETASYFEADHSTIGWEFTDVLIESIELTPLSHEASKPQVATIKASYGSYKDITS